MSEPNVSVDESKGGPDERLAMLFAQLVMQQANMAFMYLGKTAHPTTGEVLKDLEAAKLFIDQLEMLEVKTKGNLAKEEAGLLKQSLMNLRLAFVEAVEDPAAPQAEPKPSPVPETGKSQPAPAASAEQEEHRTKFSKKY